MWDDIKMEHGVEKIQLAQYAPVAAMKIYFHTKNYTMLTNRSTELGLINTNNSTPNGTS
jgi:hypothetical protein